MGEERTLTGIGVSTGSAHGPVVIVAIPWWTYGGEGGESAHERDDQAHGAR